MKIRKDKHKQTQHTDMHSLIKPKHHHLHSLFKNITTKNKTPPTHISHSLHSTPSPQPEPDLRAIQSLITTPIGGLDDLETTLNDHFARTPLTTALVNRIVDSCKLEAPTRRILRFFQWSRRVLSFDVKDEDFNAVIRVLAMRKDYIGLKILVSDLTRERRALDACTFGVLVEALVKLGKEDEALGIFKNMEEKFGCQRDSVVVSTIISALCTKGHAKKAHGVVRLHKDKIATLEMKVCVYKSLLYGWCVNEDVKEARRVIKEMKADGVIPDSFVFNTFLRCLCERNAKKNPSGLVPEALNVMMEMRTHGIEPNSISYNILLSCLCRTRRVKESCKVLELMKRSNFPGDWFSYYLVIKVLYLTGRFGKGNKFVDEMTEEGIVPDRKFYYDLIGVLCGVKRPNYAIELFDRMKKGSLGGYGPVYDLLIPKLCRDGNFEKGRELWNEAKDSCIELSCSADVLDPSVTEVFIPTRKVEEKLRLKEFPLVDKHKLRLSDKNHKRNVKNKASRKDKIKKKSFSK